MDYSVDAVKIAVQVCLKWIVFIYIEFIQTFARGLSTFRREKCPGVAVNRLGDCLAQNAGIELAKTMHKVIINK
jgi:hypothetical protein